MWSHAVYGYTHNMPCIVMHSTCIYIYIYIYIVYVLLRTMLGVYMYTHIFKSATRLMDTVGWKMSKRNAKTRLPYSPGQTAKAALGKTMARRIVNRGPVAHRDVAPVKPVTPGDTTAVDIPSSGSTGADKSETLSTALRAELLELLRSTHGQVAARSSTTTSAHEGFSSYEPPKIPTVEDFEGNLKQVMANLPLEAGLNSKSPFVQYTLRFVNSAAAATQELAENVCVGISEALTKLGVVHKALSTNLTVSGSGRGIPGPGPRPGPGNGRNYTAFERRIGNISRLPGGPLWPPPVDDNGAGGSGKR